LLLVGIAPPIRSEPASAPDAQVGTAAAEKSQNAKTGKLTVQGLKDIIDKVKDGVARPDEAVRRIQELGVDFQADEQTLKGLRDYGAKEDLIAAVRQAAPPPPQQLGTLTVRCAPVDCTIKVKDGVLGGTKNGLYEASQLAQGEATLTFESEGYESQTKALQITAQPGQLTVTLQPTNETKAKNGKRLLALMLGALGLNSETAKDFPPLTGSGAITSYAEGKQSKWNFKLEIGSPSSLVRMTAYTSADGSLVYECHGQQCNEVKKGHVPLLGSKTMQPAVAKVLEANLAALAQYQLGPVLQSLLSPDALLSAPTAEDKPDRDQQLRAEFSDFVYDVTIDRDLRPAGVVYESKSGLGSGRKITFGEYVDLAGGDKLKDGGVLRYPKHTSISLADAEQHGIEVGLDKVELWTTFRASDFGK
jgi:hypothetical protein